MALIKTQSVFNNQLKFAMFLALGTVLVAYLNVFNPAINGVVVLSGLIGLMLFVMVAVRYEYSIYFLILLATFMFYIKRIIDLSFPFGIFFDMLIVLGFAAMVLNKKNDLKWEGVMNWITYGYLLTIGLHLLQFMNPAGSFQAWLVSLRNISLFLLYLIFFHAFGTFNLLKKVTIFWLSIAMLVALYGIYQEVFGLTDFEWHWIYKVPERFKLYFIWGNMRKFSFLSDPSSYGIFLAFSGLSCVTLAATFKQWPLKALFFISALIMFVAMSYSGTRTAYATVAIGIAFFIFLTLRSRKTMLFAVALVVGFVIVLFGPFYNWQIERIRSTFQPSDDASMGVRDQKRISNQPYILSHPIGGGIYTTSFNGSEYAKGHRFAGFDPDSGYLETALEQGYVGLFLQLLFIGAVVVSGVNHYFSIKDNRIRMGILVYLVPFFALSIAHFAQNALFSKPVVIMIFMTMAMMSRAPQLARALEEADASERKL